LLERPFSRSIASYLEVPLPCNGNFDLVTLFEIESFDDGSGEGAPPGFYPIWKPA